jgi:methionyl-tRNA formyltransferase
MRVIFAGTPEFARVALAQLHAAGHDIVLVLTQPDRPGGRGMKLQSSSVKQFALEQGMAVAQPRSLRLDGKYPQDAQQAQTQILAAKADVMVVAAYGLILPQWVLDTPRLGCLNIHASLLPRWRGAAPIHRAIEAGDKQTGVTLMQMDAGLDTGDVLLTEVVPIQPQDTTGALHDKLATLGARMAVQAIELAARGQLKPVKQPSTGVTYAPKIEKSEALIDWSQNAEVIVRRVLAFNPSPGAHSRLNGETIKVWGARLSALARPENAVCGEIVALALDGIEVSAINSVVSLTELQRPGGKRMAAAEFLRGLPLSPGMRFEAHALPLPETRPHP